MRDAPDEMPVLLYRPLPIDLSPSTLTGKTERGG